MTLDVVRLWVHRVAALKDAATVVAVFMGGLWTFALFRFRRLRYPRANVQHTISHWPANGKVLLHVVVETKSVGEVILRLKSVLVRVQQLMPLPPDVAETIAAGRDPVAANESEILWQQITERRCDWTSQPREIEPGEVDEYHFDFVISPDVERIEVYSHLLNASKARTFWLWRSRKSIGWNTTTVYNLRGAEGANDERDKDGSRQTDS